MSQIGDQRVYKRIKNVIVTALVIGLFGLMVLNNIIEEMLSRATRGAKNV